MAFILCCLTELEPIMEDSMFLLPENSTFKISDFSGGGQQG